MTALDRGAIQSQSRSRNQGQSRSRNQGQSQSRRRFLATTAGAAVGGTIGADLLSRPAAAASEVDLASWFANTEDATEIVDERGQSRVEVAVGAAGNGGALAFDPVAVRVDPGATVVWTWTGEGGMHNVVAEDGPFESEYHSEAGASFEHAPDAAGVERYACTPHRSMGMRGAIVVGGVEASLGGSSGERSPGEGAADGQSPGDGSSGERSPGDCPSAAVESIDDWLDGTDNYDGVVDARGESELTVAVGADGNGGDFAFDPAAVHVDPGTTVLWEWVGAAEYDVRDAELGYHSDLVAGAGHRFGVEFGGDGLSTYECSAYGEQGMRGAVLVGDGPVSELSTTGLAALGSVGALVAVPLAYGLREHVRDTTRPLVE